MKFYRDTEGAIVQAVQPARQMLIRTAAGDGYTTLGNWVVYIEGSWPVEVTDGVFTASFTEVPE